MKYLTRIPNPSTVRHAAAASLVAFLFAAAMPFNSSAEVAMCITQPPALVGYESVMVTFDPNEDLCDPGTEHCERYGPIDSYLGVTYEALGSDSMSLVFGDSDYGLGYPTGIPVVRNMTAPLFATICIAPEGCPSIRLRLTFDDPTPFFGFGYGFNDMNQRQDGTSTPKIGKVILYNADGKVLRRINLRATRNLCCTEGRFDYKARGIGVGTRRFIAMAEIEFKYDYTPFMPGDATMVGPEFFGIDNVNYAIPGVCLPVVP
jgi:hypothetical protein